MLKENSAVLNILEEGRSDEPSILREVVIEDKAAENIRNFLEWPSAQKAAFMSAMKDEMASKKMPLTPNLVYARHRMVATAIVFAHQYLK